MFLLAYLVWIRLQALSGSCSEEAINCWSVIAFTHPSDGMKSGWQGSLEGAPREKAKQHAQLNIASKTVGPHIELTYLC